MKERVRVSILLFVLGFGVFMFARRSELFPTIGAAIVIAPIFILRFIRTQPTSRGVALTILGFVLSLNFALWNLIEVDSGAATWAINLLRSSLIAIPYSLPYIVDRLLYPRYRQIGAWSTLTFPVVTTALYFLFSLEGPFDGDAYFAVFEQGSRSFKQIASVAGLWGFVFVFSWFAAVVNWCWESQWERTKVARVGFMFALVLMFLIVCGMVRTSMQANRSADTVSVAAVILDGTHGSQVVNSELFSREAMPYDVAIARIGELIDTAGSKGAKIITFQEAATKVAQDDEARLKADIGKFAREHAVYISLCYGSFPAEGKGRNKHILVDDRGETVLDYSKRYLMGFGSALEAGMYEKGAEVIQYADTPHGRIGLSICRDMSFAPYMRQAGRQGVDIMLSPSFDVPKSTGTLYSLRAIENGFSIVRPVYNGVSYAVDFHGNVLSRMDSGDTEDGIMYADVPTRGVRAVYPRVGDALGWLCVLGLVMLVMIRTVPKLNVPALSRDRRTVSHEST